MTLVEEIREAMDRAGREAEYTAARNLLMGAEDGPERQEALIYVGKRLGLLDLEMSGPPDQRKETA